MSKPIDKSWITTTVVKAAALMIFVVAFWPLLTGLHLIGIVNNSFKAEQASGGSVSEATEVGGIAYYGLASIWLGVAALLFIVAIFAFIGATVLSRKHRKANNTEVKS